MENPSEVVLNFTHALIVRTAKVSVLRQERHSLLSVETSGTMNTIKNSYLDNEMMSVVGLSLHCSSYRCNGQAEANHRVFRCIIIRMKEVDCR